MITYEHNYRTLYNRIQKTCAVANCTVKYNAEIILFSNEREAVKFFEKVDKYINTGGAAGPIGFPRRAPYGSTTFAHYPGDYSAYVYALDKNKTLYTVLNSGYKTHIDRGPYLGWAYWGRK